MWPQLTLLIVATRDFARYITSIRDSAVDALFLRAVFWVFLVPCRTPVDSDRRTTQAARMEHDTVHLSRDGTGIVEG